LRKSTSAQDFHLRPTDGGVERLDADIALAEFFNDATLFDSYPAEARASSG
jgi:hypothetical protein